MSDKYISSIHINKLGHNIEEIRERALYNIVSKLEHGFIYDNELARSKEIIIKLLDWFNFERCTCEDIVLNLIKRILKTECGHMLIDLFGVGTLTTELLKIKNIINCKYHDIVDAILELFQTEAEVVPPLNIEPLKMQGTTEFVSNYIPTPTYNPLNTIFIQSHNNESLSIDESSKKKYKDISQITSEIVQYSSDVPSIMATCFPHYVLMWQNIVSADKHVLESMEQSLRHPGHPNDILHSCDFFMEIMLHDFPAEIFLQRPAIVMCFHDLLWSSSSSRIATAILKCLNGLSDALKKRVNYFRDPCTHNLKQNITHNKSSQNSSSHNSCNSSDINESIEETNVLMKNQISLPQYSLNTIQSVLKYLYKNTDVENQSKRKKCQIGINTSLSLLKNTIELLILCVKQEIWNNKENKIVQGIINKINEIFLKFGRTIDHFRIVVLSNDWDDGNRTIYLHLLANFVILTNYLIPCGKYDEVIPKPVQHAIANCILDPCLCRLYPNLHESLFLIVNEFDSAYENDSREKYRLLKNVTKSMSAAVKFLTNWKSYSTIKNITLAKESLISFEFHQHSNFIKLFLDVCTNKLTLNTYDDDILDKIDYVIVSLLSHKNSSIKEETYKQCHKKVMSTIGPKLIVEKGISTNNILYLFRNKVLTEIALYGVSDLKVAKYAEDILLYILKCKMLVSDDIWQSAVTALIPVLSVLCCQIDKNALGHTVLCILDPDKGKSLNIPMIEIIKVNCVLLFSENGSIREEAVSRLGWLLSTQENYMQYLPHLNNLHDKALSVVTQLKTTQDLNRCKPVPHFYQPSSLHQVIELLNSPNVEPIIRRSAITQISVMIEDPLLHATFIEQGGVSTIKCIMKSALIEDSYKDYPDAVIPCITILKNVVLYNATIRQELANDSKIYFYILRGLFLFCTEDRMKEDGSILLFSLVFTNYLVGSPLKNDFALVDLVHKTMTIPFQCKIHSKISLNMLPDLSTELTSDKWSLSTLQIYWNIEWYGGLKQILNWSEVEYDKKIAFNDILKLNNNNLRAIKCTSIEYCVQNGLEMIKNANSHKDVFDVVNNLTGLIQLYYLVKDDINIISSNMLQLPWEKSFQRYLNTPPSSPDDNVMLAHIFKFLETIVPIFKSSDTPCWISSMLCNDTYCIPDILATKTTREADFKTLSNALLNLITTCVYNDQYYLNFHSTQHANIWNHLTAIIVEHLQFNDAHHFYNLAHLDCLLTTLVHLTSGFGWSNSRPNEKAKPMLKKLITGLCELIVNFHCGKGESAGDSVMGLSITRHVILILNHALGEIQQHSVIDWEACFFDNEIRLQNLCTLWFSRDLILRVGILHLFAGLAISPRGAVNLVQDVRSNDKNIWELCISILLDQDEASAVKENAAILLANISSHTSNVGSSITLVKSLIPNTIKHTKGDINIIINMLEEYGLFKELETILSCLYTENSFYFQTHSCDAKCSMYCSQQTQNEQFMFAYTCDVVSPKSILSCNGSNLLPTISTPGLVKAIALFVHNMLQFAPQQISQALLEVGLLKLFFRCVCTPNIELLSTHDLSVLCDILEMNISICLMLSRALLKNNLCLVTVCNTRDCLNMLLSLLNPALYHIELPELLYLRNKLWCAIFNLISIILKDTNEEFSIATTNVNNFEAFAIVTSILLDTEGQQPFLQTLCESIKSNSPIDLQQSALSSLTTLLHHESNTDISATSLTSRSVNSMATILDTVKTPRSTFSKEYYGNDENTPNNNQIKSCQVFSTKETYFEYHMKVGNMKKYDMNEELVAGAELCKILLGLFEVSTFNKEKSFTNKKKSVMNTLSSILYVSKEAKLFALEHGLVLIIIRQLQDLHIQLNLESVECLRRVADKKRVCPILEKLESFLGLLTNFMHQDADVKWAASKLGLADLYHKLWIWLQVQKPLLTVGLRMLCTYTTDCFIACQSLCFTSPVAGSGPRKAPSNVSLLYAICMFVRKEMDQLSKKHDLTLLRFCFQILGSSVQIGDCRIVLIKSNIFQSLTRLHPAITKRQKPWDQVEVLWLDLLNIFTTFSEGQACVAKLPDVFELVLLLTNSHITQNKELAMAVLRNISFHSPNRPRLIGSDEFINVLDTKMSSGTMDEKKNVVAIIWAIAANNQKAKLIFKCANFDTKLEEMFKLIKLSACDAQEDDLKLLYNVLNLFSDIDR